jgi:hypothetical protein
MAQELEQLSLPFRFARKYIRSLERARLRRIRHAMTTWIGPSLDYTNPNRPRLSRHDFEVISAWIETPEERRNR